MNAIFNIDPSQARLLSNHLGLLQEVRRSGDAIQDIESSDLLFSCFETDSGSGLGGGDRADHPPKAPTISINLRSMRAGAKSASRRRCPSMTRSRTGRSYTSVPSI